MIENGFGDQTVCLSSSPFPFRALFQVLSQGPSQEPCRAASLVHDRLGFFPDFVAEGEIYRFSRDHGHEVGPYLVHGLFHEDHNDQQRQVEHRANGFDHVVCESELYPVC